jgi:uncharacterized protein
MNAKPIAVFDTQMLLRATINRKSLPAKLFFDLNATYHLAASTQTIAEAKEVLNRPVLRTKFSTLTDEAVNEMINLLVNARQAVLKEIARVSRDPKDDIFLATALEAQADYLISEDQDLLVLNPYQGIHIINAVNFLHVLQTIQAADNPPPSA